MQDHANGTYSAAFVSTVAGFWQCAHRFLFAHRFDSVAFWLDHVTVSTPTVLHIVPNVVAPLHCTVSHASQLVSDLNSTMLVSFFDQFDNAVAADNATVAVAFSDTSLRTAATTCHAYAEPATPLATARSLLFGCAAAGRYQVDVRAGNLHAAPAPVQGSPFVRETRCVGVC